MSVTVNYKDSILTTIDNGESASLQTGETWVEDDINIIDTTPTGSVSNEFDFQLNKITGQLTVSVPVTTGYVTGGTVSSAYYIPIVPLASRTITPSAQDQVINGEQYIPIGGITVEGDPDLIASNILSTANIFGVQGSVNLRTYYTGSAAPAAALGNNGDIYFQTAN